MNGYLAPLYAVYVVSRHVHGESLDLRRAFTSLEAARQWTNRQWHVEVFRETHDAWKGTNGVDEYWVHRIELMERAG